MAAAVQNAAPTMIGFIPSATGIHPRKTYISAPTGSASAGNWQTVRTSERRSARHALLQGQTTGIVECHYYYRR